MVGDFFLPCPKKYFVGIVVGKMSTYCFICSTSTWAMSSESYISNNKTRVLLEYLLVYHDTMLVSLLFFFCNTPKRRSTKECFLRVSVYPTILTLQKEMWCECGSSVYSPLLMLCRWWKYTLVPRKLSRVPIESTNRKYILCNVKIFSRKRQDQRFIASC